MTYTLVITEKPSSAKKISDALADSKPVKKVEKSVSYYMLSHKGEDLVIAPAVGHLYGLAEVKKSKSFSYPVFDIDWFPIADVRKQAGYSEKYLTLLKKLAKKANKFVVATDFDIEGETLGYNIVRFACKQKDAQRMKFSALTKHDLSESWANLQPTIEWGQAEAGVTRHMLDWYYGINLSRALSSSIKKAGMFKILSTGRVQGPALKILVDKEKEIKAFKPVPYWEIHLEGKYSRKKILAQHSKGKFEDKKEATKIFKKVKDSKEGVVDDIQATRKNQRAPTPFDLTTLQTEAYRSLGIPPKRTLDIAQNLYLRGLISYPRTSSQQLPPTIGYRTLLTKLSKQQEYMELAGVLLTKKSLKPANGKKKDPAHPAIYPTGVLPKTFEGQAKRIYDLVVRRFMATFGEDAVRETVKANLLVKEEPFVTKGTRTVEQGWFMYYGPHVKLSEEELPAMKKGDVIKVGKIEQHDKETQPPRRYSESSIIRELEKRNLGTKATRANIIDTLINRHYITGKSLEATDLGIQISEILERHVPRIVDEALTRHFEMEMDGIRERKKKWEDVISEAQKLLLGLLDQLKKDEDAIGEELKKTFMETRAALTTLGKCVVCKDGMVTLRKGKYGRFAACDKYPDCTQTYKLPAGGMVKPIEKICETCKHPMVQMIRARRKPQEVCLNLDCPTKVTEGVLEGEGKPCSKCEEGKLVVRKSVYGQFLACGRFPKCRHIERTKKKEDPKAAKKPAKKAKKKTTKKGSS
ncbi:MAG: DNA topoisomerase I [Candidatus Nanoarchaeia archaeon]